MERKPWLDLGNSTLVRTSAHDGVDIDAWARRARVRVAPTNPEAPVTSALQPATDDLAAVEASWSRGTYPSPGADGVFERPPIAIDGSSRAVSNRDDGVSHPGNLNAHVATLHVAAERPPEERELASQARHLSDQQAHGMGNPVQGASGRLLLTGPDVRANVLDRAVDRATKMLREPRSMARSFRPT